MNAKDVKEWARGFGADLIGIAAIERFAELPAERNPLSIFPECRSVLVLGRRILRGALRGVEEGVNFQGTYGCFGFRWLEDNFLAQTTYNLTCRIEAEGFEATPLFGYADEGLPRGRPVAEGKPAPNVIVDPDFCAKAAGLGCTGKGGWLLTPEYGHRQRLALILTDAKLAADAVAEYAPCANCKACVAACPFGAIQESKVDYAVCRKCPNGTATAPGRGSRPDRLAAACARACLVELEKNKRCSNAFQQPFRKRTAWALDLFGRPIAAADKNGGRS
jgi:ferredoxin